MIIAQQTQTLLHTLQSKQPPKFPIFLLSQLQKIDFDFSTKSLEILTNFLTQLQKKGFSAQKILTQTGGKNFLLAIAVYLGEYVAKTTGTSIVWCDYQTAVSEIASQNQQHGTDFQLVETFANSLLANIGGVYCQPLAVLEKTLVGENVLPNFITNMQQQIFQKNQVHLFDEPNLVAKHYLQKIATGKLLDNTIAFFDELQSVEFDFSQKSLEKIDNILENIQQKQQLTKNDYTNFIQQADFQYFCYLLGFYIGMTASKLSDIAVKWESFDNMQAIFDEDFDNCLEHRFVLLMENHYRTPMLIITNRLFGIAPNFPKTAVEFAKILHEQNADILHKFLLKPIEINYLAKAWQQSVTLAVRLLDDAFQTVSAGKIFNPTLMYLQKNAQNSRYELQSWAIDNVNIEQAIDDLYTDMALYQRNSPIVLGCYPMFANLPTGRQQAMTLEWRCQNPNLNLQVIIPYQNIPDFAIFPAVSNQKNLSSEMIAVIQFMLYQFSLQKNGNGLWADFFQQDFVVKFKNYPAASAIDLAVLPVGKPLEAIGLNLATPEFEASRVRWKGFDLPKYVLQLSGVSQSYLQVLTPKYLINNELFSQVNAMNELYHFGKVVWGAVVKADKSLFEPSDLIDVNHALTAQIVYDPTGQASVDKLLAMVKRLQTLQTADVSQLSGNQAFIAMHLQDERSAVFGYQVAQNLHLSTTWVWRRHLPTAMLSDRLVPIVISSKSDSQYAGRVMILPSRFWQQRQDDGQNLYQYWINLSVKQFGKNLDIMPTILAEEEQGVWYEKAEFNPLQSQIFPKLKLNIHTKPNTANKKADIDQSISNVANDKPAIPQSPILQPQTDAEPMFINKPLTVSPPTTNLTPELQRQLLADQARLMSQLSTKDADKERKLYLIMVVVAVVVLLAILMAIVLKK